MSPGGWSERELASEGSVATVRALLLTQSSLRATAEEWRD